MNLLKRLLLLSISFWGMSFAEKDLFAEINFGKLESGGSFGILAEAGYFYGAPSLGFDVIYGAEKTYFSVNPLFPIAAAIPTLPLLAADNDFATIIAVAFIIFASVPAIHLELRQGTRNYALYEKHQFDVFLPHWKYREKLSAGLRLMVSGVGAKLGYYRSFSKFQDMRSKGWEATIFFEFDS